MMTPTSTEVRVQAPPPTDRDAMMATVRALMASGMSPREAAWRIGLDIGVALEALHQPRQAEYAA